MIAPALLPRGFESLEPFVEEWVLPDAAARMAKRQSSDISKVVLFYDAMLALGESALGHLRGFSLGDMPAAEERLLKLMLSLAEVAPAVEWYKNVRVYDGFPIERVRYLRQISDTTAQC